MACVGTPVESLKVYATAFQQARNAGDLLLDEISPIVSSVAGSASSNCGRSPLGYPLCFEPALALVPLGSRTNEDASVKARRDALLAVSVYNSMLVDLAEGKSVAAVEARIDEFSGLANALSVVGGVAGAGLPALIGPGTVFVKDFARRFDTARANGAVRQAILGSKDDIKQLLAALAADTPNMYQVFLKARERDLVAINHDRNSARLSGNAEGQSRAGQRYDATLASIGKFHESLGSYVQLLDRTSNALDSLVAAANETTGTVSSATALIREAAEIQAKADEFWNKIREVRAAAASANK